jgi:heat shock protein HslJ
MKKNLFAVFIIGCLFTACDSTKKTTAGMTDPSKLAGTWELNYITGPRIAFDGLYPNKKPTISFDVANKRVSGNSSCNSFNGKLNVDGNKINFTEPMAMTQMMCPGEGENVFVSTLKKVNAWSVSNDTVLNLIMGDIAVMRFVKK